MPKKSQAPPSESSSDAGEMAGFDPSSLIAMMRNANVEKDFLSKLHEPARNCVHALKGFNSEYEVLEKEFKGAIQALEKKYAKLRQPLYQDRCKVVNGIVDVTEEQVKAGLKCFDEEIAAEITMDGKDDGSKKIEGFWGQVLQHHVMIAEMVGEQDEEILDHITDVTCGEVEEPDVGFFLQFTFETNKFMKGENPVLTKTFLMEFQDGDYVLSKGVGTPIEWTSPEVNPTIEITSKKQKNKKGQVRHVTKEEPRESFFELFEDRSEPKGHEENDLMEQEFAFDEDITVAQRQQQVFEKVKENIKIGRFEVFEI